MANKALLNYLNYSTLFCLFSEALRLRSTIDLKLYYFIIIINLFLLIGMSPRKINYTLSGLIFIIFLFIVGIFKVYSNTNTIPLLAQQLVGIFISSLYFYNYFKFTNLSVIELFEKYCKIAVFVSVIGIVLTVFFFINGDFSYRLQSVFTEPAHFCGVVLPSFYYFLKNRKEHFKSFLIVTAAIVLSASSVGYLGILICLLIYPKKINLLVNSIVVTVCLAIGIIIYNNVENFRLRVSDTYSSLTTFNVTDVNLSSYALISNFFVATKVFEESPVLGNGLGSHRLSHQKYIKQLKGSDTFNDYITFNSEDANSLFTRVLSDLGIAGLLIITYFIFKNYTSNEHLYIISRAILVYFFYKLFREGHYFSPEMYFFVFAYIFLKKSGNEKQEKIAQLSLL